MDEEYAKPRDLDADLVEITSRLGEPDASYRTDVRRAIWRFILGIMLILGAAALHYVLWTGIVPFPRNAIFWKVLFIGLFLSPAWGLYLITFAIRGMRLWVLVYPNGLFVWHRGRVVAFPWDEIRAVQIHGVPQKSAIIHSDKCVLFDLHHSRRRVFGTSLLLTRTDGEQISLSSMLDGFPELSRRVQKETYEHLFAERWAELQGGRTVSFGPIMCSRRDISLGKRKLPWHHLYDIVRVADKLQIKQLGKKKPWAICSFHDIINPHVLLGIAQAAHTGSQSA